MPNRSLEIEFGDGRYTFALPVTHILELQNAAGAGIFELYDRVVIKQTPTLKDVLETARLALIGGGRGLVMGEVVEVDALRARQLVETYLHPPVPLRQAFELSATILFGLIEGYDDGEDQKKSPSDDLEADPDGLNPPPPSPTASSSASTPTGSPSGNTRRSGQSTRAGTTRTRKRTKPT